MERAPVSVSRSIELPVPVEEAWASLRDAEGLGRWLGDRVELDVAPGAAGTVAEGDTVRQVVVTEVDEGRSIGLVWWDEAAPDEASLVTIAVTSADGGLGSQVTVTERLAGAASATVGGASIGDLAAVEPAWDRRLQALVGATALAPACV